MRHRLRHLLSVLLCLSLLSQGAVAVAGAGCGHWLADAAPAGHAGHHASPEQPAAHAAHHAASPHATAGHQPDMASQHGAAGHHVHMASHGATSPAMPADMECCADGCACVAPCGGAAAPLAPARLTAALTIRAATVGATALVVDPAAGHLLPSLRPPIQS